MMCTSQVVDRHVLAFRKRISGELQQWLDEFKRSFKITMWEVEVPRPAPVLLRVHPMFCQPQVQWRANWSRKLLEIGRLCW